MFNRIFNYTIIYEEKTYKKLNEEINQDTDPVVLTLF